MQYKAITPTTRRAAAILCKDCAAP